MNCANVICKAVNEVTKMLKIGHYFIDRPSILKYNLQMEKSILHLFYVMKQWPPEPEKFRLALG